MEHRSATGRCLLRRDKFVYDIKVRDSGGRDVRVELRGEFDMYALDERRKAPSNALSFRRPTVVDLSGITFLDVQSTRKLAIVCRPYAHHLTLIDPSCQVRASIEAYVLRERFYYKSCCEDSRKASFPNASRHFEDQL